MDNRLQAAAEAIKNYSTSGGDLLEGMENMQAMIDNGEHIFEADLKDYYFVFNQMKAFFHG